MHHAELNERCKEYEGYLRWLAQTVHQGYHHGDWHGLDLDTITWRECPKNICSSTRRLLKDQGAIP